MKTEITKKSVKDIVIEIVSSQSGVSDDITIHSTWEEIWVDDLDRIEIAMNVENRFAISISDEDVEGFKTVGDLINYIEKRIAHENS